MPVARLCFPVQELANVVEAQAHRAIAADRLEALLVTLVVDSESTSSKVAPGERRIAPSRRIK